jgi:hypothetical protein
MFSHLSEAVENACLKAFCAQDTHRSIIAGDKAE